MTREEQINLYLKERNIPITSLEADSIIEGIKWADEHPKLYKMKLWAARDKDDSLCLYSKEPKLSEEVDDIWVCGQYGMPVEVIALPSKMFPEVTFENSPQEVELKLVN